ncbi:uncharacterized protein JCM6883_001158 [Sporobolomyces salmoneus]|uniref:uncharacterized protein n=1 Tax=Sporobolomyces salmoneus TaxID=183962 RepID=UPI00316F5128
MQNQTDLYAPSTYTAVDFVVGLLITVGASLTTALSLNITKLDLSRQEAIPAAQRKADYLRPFWLLGLVLYIASQVVGSTLALSFLPAQYVAPLSSSSLIFNFIFAYLLVGTPIAKLDIIGTAIIVLSIVGIVVFGNQKRPSDFDADANLSLSTLKVLWGRSDWIAYFICLEVAIVLAWWISGITHEVCMARITDDRGDADRDGSGIEAMVGGGGGRRVANPYEGEGFMGTVKSTRDRFVEGRGKLRAIVKRSIERWSQSRPDASIRKAAGFAWAVTGGLLSGETLILAKSGVKLVTSAIHKTDPNEANQFTSPLTWIIIILLVVCAVAQVYCLNMGLKCYDSTFQVPIFFSVYTVSGFINSLVYLDETHLYKLWVFLMIWFSIAVLIVGVAMLALKKPPRVQRPRAGSSVSQRDFDNPFNDVELDPTGDSPKPGPSRATTGDIENGAVDGEEQAKEMKRGQGLLGKLFGGLPEGSVAGGAGRVRGNSSASARARPGEPSQKQRRRQEGMQRLDDGDSVLEPPSERNDAEELDDVDGLSKYGGGSRHDDQEEEEWGEFEKPASLERRQT